MYIKMKITVLFVTLMWVLFASSASQDLKFVYINGSDIQVHRKTLCYQQWYDVQCDKDWFAPIRNIFSLKDPAFSSANNCTGQKTYPEQCCDVDPTDCNFTSIKDFDQIRKVCSGKTYCKGQRAPWHPVYESKPNMHCTYQQGLANVLTTQYVTTEYMCAPYQSIVPMCVKGTKQGEGLFLSSKDYPNYYPKQTGFNCSCQVVFGTTAVLKVAAIDLRLCSNSNRCGRTLSIGDAKPISVTNTKEEDPSLAESIYGIVGMKEIYSAASSGHVTMELTDVDSKDELYLWMYLYAEGSVMTVTCDGETTFTTPTTTTTTTTTTTPTTSTTPTTPTRSTTPTTTSILTTPVTTTPTTTASSSTKHQTSTPVAQNTPRMNISFNYDQLCNCERVSALSQKLYYIELAASALGGIVFTAICWCTYSLCHTHKKAKKAKKRRRKVSDQYAMHGGRRNYFNNDTRSVYSIEPGDSASQVGGPKQRKLNHVNRNQQAARQAQGANHRGSNQGVPRKISVTHDVPNEYDEIEQGSTKIKDEEVQSKDDIINKLANRLHTHPTIEKVVRQQAKERVNCHYENDINDETDIKIILGGFGLEILENTLSEMESQDQSYSF